MYTNDACTNNASIPTIPAISTLLVYTHSQFYLHLLPFRAVKNYKPNLLSD